jgi:hypothetical protein
MQITRKPRPRFCSALAAFVSLACAATSTQAGLGPTNILLVVNQNDAGSKAIANDYIALRKLSPNNVLYLDWKLGDRTVTISQFRNEILGPIQRFLAKRKLTEQIDCIVYSSGLPYGVDFAADIPAELRDSPVFQFQFKFPTASVTGLTYLQEDVLTSDPTKYTAFNANRYMRLRETSARLYFQLPTDAKGQLAQTVGHQQFTAKHIDPTSIGSHGFRARYGWGSVGELQSDGGRKYVLSVMLGVTNGTASTITEIRNYLRTSQKADGQYPKGTIYFMKERSKDQGIRSKVREPGYAMALEKLHELQIEAEVLSGALPDNKRDVQGLMTGIDQFDWKRSGSTILPGAICDNLTSFGALFDQGTAQTPCTEFLRFGAAGTMGTVYEPYSVQNKFPHAMIQVHYARGCTLAEAFYQSLYMPYQSLVLGDPLCRPWANIPKVSVEGVTERATLKGTVKIKPSAELPRGGQCTQFELFMDGDRFATCPAGGTLELDTTTRSDGYHELRIVGIEQRPIESQGETILNVQFDNSGRTMEFTAAIPAPGKPVAVSAKCAGAEGIAVYHNGRTVATIQGESGAADIDPRILGDGLISLTAIAWREGKAYCLAAPAKLMIRTSGGQR